VKPGGAPNREIAAVMLPLNRGHLRIRLTHRPNDCPKQLCDWLNSDLPCFYSNNMLRLLRLLNPMTAIWSSFPFKKSLRATFRVTGHRVFIQDSDRPEASFKLIYRFIGGTWKNLRKFFTEVFSSRAHRMGCRHGDLILR